MWKEIGKVYLKFNSVIIFLGYVLLSFNPRHQLLPCQTEAVFSVCFDCVEDAGCLEQSTELKVRPKINKLY